MFEQQLNVAGALPQGRQSNLAYIDAEIEVVTESFVCDLLLQVTICCRQQTNIDRRLFPAANPPEAAFLQGTEQLGLLRQRQFANLVEKQRATIRVLHQTQGALICSSERAAFMAEKLTHEEVGRNRAAVDRDKRVQRPFAVCMDIAGNQFLARPSLAPNEHVNVS